MLDLKETDVILMTLTLLDLTLVASLVLMMIFAGYENFVSRIDTGDDHRPSWMGTPRLRRSQAEADLLDRGDLGHRPAQGLHEHRSDRKDELMWKVITHMTFVLSGVLLALMDYLTERAKKLQKV